MVPIASLAMVGAGAACLGGAVFSRKWIAIVSATIMFLAMLDLALFGVVLPLIWAAALLLAGLLLGFELRLSLTGPNSLTARTGPAGLAAPAAPAAPGRQGKAALVASALAYPVTAWLVLGHGPATGLGAGAGAVTVHAGHGASAPILAAPLVLAWGLTAVLLMLCASSIRRRQTHPAVETGAMAVMIVAMLGMSH